MANEENQAVIRTLQVYFKKSVLARRYLKLYFFGFPSTLHLLNVRIPMLCAVVSNSISSTQLSLISFTCSPWWFVAGLPRWFLIDFGTVLPVYGLCLSYTELFFRSFPAFTTCVMQVLFQFLHWPGLLALVGYFATFCKYWRRSPWRSSIHIFMHGVETIFGGVSNVFRFSSCALTTFFRGVFEIMFHFFVLGSFPTNPGLQCKTVGLHWMEAWHRPCASRWCRISSRGNDCHFVVLVGVKLG